MYEMKYIYVAMHMCAVAEALREFYFLRHYMHNMCACACSYMQYLES